jgi:hypothetical protein
MSIERGMGLGLRLGWGVSIAVGVWRKEHCKLRVSLQLLGIKS